MRSFRYLRDELFIVSVLAYAINRWLVKPHVHSAFLRGQFNDALLIPCALPVLLLIQRRLGLRTHDQPPTPGEISLNLVVWSLLFEVVGPHIMHVTGDPLDVIAYAVGAVVAALWWNRERIIRPGISDEF